MCSCVGLHTHIDAFLLHTASRSGISGERCTAVFSFSVNHATVSPVLFWLRAPLAACPCFSLVSPTLGCCFLTLAWPLDGYLTISDTCSIVGWNLLSIWGVNIFTAELLGLWVNLSRYPVCKYFLLGCGFSFQWIFIIYVKRFLLFLCLNLNLFYVLTHASGIIAKNLA